MIEQKLFDDGTRPHQHKALALFLKHVEVRVTRTWPRQMREIGEMNHTLSVGIVQPYRRLGGALGRAASDRGVAGRRFPWPSVDGLPKGAPTALRRWHHGSVPMTRFKDVIEQFDHVDDPDVLEKAKTNSALAHALGMSRPRNWHGTGLTPDQILPIATDSAIPVAWVPPGHVLRALAAAAPTDRVRVLLVHEAEILDECRTLLKECEDAWVKEERTLITRAVAAYDAGFFEAAMALAVAIGEPLALWASEPRVQSFDSEAAKVAWEAKKKAVGRYGVAKLELGAVNPGDKLNRIEILRHALIGPIDKFFTPFHANPGEQIPPTVSRHATVHKPTVTHLSKQNALIALMLDVSILREQQEWAVEVRMEEAFYDES